MDATRSLPARFVALSALALRARAADPPASPPRPPLSARSCEDKGWAVQLTASGRGVCGHSFSGTTGCSGELDWPSARAFCEGGGVRLCAGDELFAARKTGCGINMEQLWTWDACGVDDGTPHHLRSHVAMRGDMDNVTTCSGGGTKYNTRCCADPQAEMDAFHEETQPPLSEASCEQKGWGVDADLGVCGASQINKVCSGAVSLQDARAFCERGRARLCTLTELPATLSTGCEANALLAWTETPCEGGGRIVAQSHKVGAQMECKEGGGKTAIARCCADVFAATGGGGGGGGGDHPATPRRSRKTCEEKEWEVVTPSRGDPVCGGSYRGGSCSGDLAWAEARDWCEKGGARLCTADEIGRGAADKTGCGLQGKKVWAWDGCGAGMHTIAALTNDGLVESCKAQGEKRPVRCCADPAAQGGGGGKAGKSGKGGKGGGKGGGGAEGGAEEAGLTGETAENHTTLWVGVVILCGAILCLCVVIVRSLPVWAARRQRERGQRFSDGDAAAETPGGSAARGLPREVTPVGVEMGANGVEGGVEKGDGAPPI